MVLAILLGGIFGLLVAGGVLVAGTIKQARRDQDDINNAFAEARGEKHDPVIGPAPWSSIDMEALVEEGVAVDRSDPYATLTGSNAFVSWSHSTEASDGDDIPSLDAEPQVIIFVVALRAIADAVEATLTSGGSTQWDGLEDALAHVRSSYERGNGSVRRSSIDVGGHDRPATDGSSSRIIREGRSAPRRTGPSRRHNGPKPITWRAAGRCARTGRP